MLLCVHQLVANCVCRLFGAEQVSRLWVFSAFLLKTAASENDFMTLHTWKSEPRFALMSLWSSLFCFLIEITWVDYRARVLKSLRTVLELGHPATIDDLFVDEHRRLCWGHDVSSVQFLSFSSRVLKSCHTECLLLWLTSCNLNVQIINGWNHGFYSNRLNRRFLFLFCFFFAHYPPSIRAIRLISLTDSTCHGPKSWRQGLDWPHRLVPRTLINVSDNSWRIWTCAFFHQNSLTQFYST